jgi:hypothetical protein
MVCCSFVVLLETPAFKGEFERAVAEKLNGNLVLDVHLIAWFVCTSKHTMFFLLLSLVPCSETRRVDVYLLRSDYFSSSCSFSVQLLCKFIIQSSEIFMIL